MTRAKMEGCGASSSDDCTRIEEAKPRRGRPCSKRAVKQGKQKDNILKVSCEEKTSESEEEKEVLRTIEEGLEDSFELFRCSDEEEAGEGRLSEKSNSGRLKPRNDLAEGAVLVTETIYVMEEGCTFAREILK